MGIKHKKKLRNKKQNTYMEMVFFFQKRGKISKLTIEETAQNTTLKIERVER